MSQPIRPIVVIGGGGHARVVIRILARLPQFSLTGYTDLADRGPLFGVPYLGDDAALAALVGDRGQHAVALGVGQVGYGDRRAELWTQLSSLALDWPPVVSADAVVDTEAQIGAAAVVMPGAVVNCGAVLGRGAIVNTGSIVEHDSHIGDWVHIAPGATICGGVTVGERTMIGAGAVVIEGCRIAPGSMIGAGATVLSDITAPGVYAGTPARQIR